MKIGYARVSTGEQNLDLQRHALKKAGCRQIFEDQVSGTVSRRPGLDRTLETLKHGDVLVVWKLDRLGRSLSHLIGLIQELGEKGVGFRSLSENIDTTTAGGRLMFHLMGSLAEFERALIAERTKAGIAAARKRGVQVGRKKALTPAQIEYARTLIEKGDNPTAVAKILGVGRSTLYRTLHELR